MKLNEAWRTQSEKKPKLILNVLMIIKTTCTERNTRFFYKNTLYKNIQDEIYQKVKNVNS